MNIEEAVNLIRELSQTAFGRSIKLGYSNSIASGFISRNLWHSVYLFTPFYEENKIDYSIFIRIEAEKNITKCSIVLSDSETSCATLCSSVKDFVLGFLCYRISKNQYNFIDLKSNWYYFKSELLDLHIRLGGHKDSFERLSQYIQDNPVDQFDIYDMLELRSTDPEKDKLITALRNYEQKILNYDDFFPIDSPWANAVNTRLISLAAENDKLDKYIYERGNVFEDERLCQLAHDILKLPAPFDTSSGINDIYETVSHLEWNNLYTNIALIQSIGSKFFTDELYIDMLSVAEQSQDPTLQYIHLAAYEDEIRHQPQIAYNHLISASLWSTDRGHRALPQAPQLAIHLARQYHWDDTLEALLWNRQYSNGWDSLEFA